MAGENTQNLFDGLDLEGIIPSQESQSQSTQEPDEGSNKDNFTDDSQELQNSGEDTDSVNTDEPDEGDNSSKDGSNNNDNSSPLTPYAKLLVDEGILPNFKLEEFDGSATGLKDAVINEINTGVETYKASLPEEIRKWVEYYDQGVNLSDLLQIENQQMQYASIQDSQIESSVDLQKNIVKDYYLNTTNFSEDKINKLISQYEDLGQLEEEAKSGIKDLINLQEQEKGKLVEESRRQQEEYRKLQEKTLNDFKANLDKTTEIIPGLKLDNSIRDKIYKINTVPVAQDEYGRPINAIAKKRMEDPIGFETALSYIYLITNGFKDWSRVTATGKNQAVNEFEKSVDVFNKTQRSKATPNMGSKNTGNAIDAIDFYLNTTR